LEEIILIFTLENIKTFVLGSGGIRHECFAQLQAKICLLTLFDAYVKILMKYIKNSIKKLKYITICPKYFHY